MVTAESLCCGTPVVGLEAGGPESIALKEFCSFVRQGDIESLINAIKNTSYLLEKLCISAHSIDVYSQLFMELKYVEIYR